MKLIPNAIKSAFYALIFFILVCCNEQSIEKVIINKDWEGKVMTVKGLIPADSMGITLPHEHLLIECFKSDWDLTDEAIAIEELNYFSASGGKTLTELTTIGLGRNPEGLKRISEATGINIIMGSGYYKSWWLHDSIKSKSVLQLTDRMVSDIVIGVRGIHAGVIGEIGIHKPHKRFGITRYIRGFEKKLLIATANAQNITGASVILHFDIDEDAKARNYALDILEKNGADLTRVSISHNSPYVNRIEDFINYAQRGCFVAFDNLGLEVSKPHWDNFYSKGKLDPVETIKILIGRGYLRNILISQDVYMQDCYVKNGGYGYAHVLNNIVPQLKTGGLTEEQINTIIIENPKRLLSF